MAVASAPFSVPEITDKHVELYAELGRTGFVLWFRDQFDKQNPSPEVLRELAAQYERKKIARSGRFIKAIIDAAT